MAIAVTVAALLGSKLWTATRAAVTGPFEIETERITSFNSLGIGTTFGPFEWRGGLTLRSPQGGFGGLSGLVLSENCEHLLSVSDKGRWLSARLSYDGGTLAGIGNAQMEPLHDARGKVLTSKPWADSEALTDLGHGKIGVAFERKVRFGAYDIGAKGLDAPFAAIPHPPAIDNGPNNGEVESFGLLPSGAFIAIAEKQRDANGDPRAWIWSGQTTTSFTVKRYGNYDVTDLALLPDGTVLTLERSFTKSTLPGMAIRHFDPAKVKDGQRIEPDLLLEASLPLYAIDNMEGIAVCTRDGETRVTLQSDDNFNAGLQSTILLQFAWKPE